MSELDRLLKWINDTSNNVQERHANAKSSPLWKEEEFWWGSQRKRAETVKLKVEELAMTLENLRMRYLDAFGKPQTSKTQERKGRVNKKKSLKRLSRAESHLVEKPAKISPLLRSLKKMQTKEGKIFTSQSCLPDGGSGTIVH